MRWRKSETQAGCFGWRRLNNAGASQGSRVGSCRVQIPARIPISQLQSAYRGLFILRWWRLGAKKLLEIGLKKRRGEIKESWNDLAKGTPFRDGEAFRLWVKNQVNPKRRAEQPQRKETVEIHSDGSQSSHRLIYMTFEESKDPEYLLKAHGYDVDAWELVSARSNIWNAYSKQDGIQTLYSSRITVKPRNTFTFERLLEKIKDIPPVEITKRNTEYEGRMLEIPLFDQHFGVSDYEYYRETQIRILTKLISRKWKEILLIIGQDLFHNDDFRGRTANGTQIQQVDMPQAWADALRFYGPIIETSIEVAERVKVIYSKGNHDESFSWTFVQLLKAKYPQAEFDDALVERKCHVFGDNFIGITHGDKARKNLHNIFPVEFPLEWSRAKNREIHTGHYHVEDGKDVFGMMVRTLATRNKTDKWHRDNGFVGAHKRFMLFEYSTEALESIHYV
jgi:hypothetical protein